MTKRAIAVLPLLIATGVTIGCDSGVGPAAAGANQAAAVDNVLRCGSVVDDTGFNGRPLTTGLAIALLTEMQLAGGAVSIPRGKPTTAVIGTLDTMAVELMGYSGSRLSDDAEAFAVAEENYHPNGPVDASYARPLEREVAALQRDCPDGRRLGRQWHDAGRAGVSWSALTR
ncbi:MAG: hypothetical protein ACRDNS_15825 [Trebonia sp.]